MFSNLRRETLNDGSLVRHAGCNPYPELQEKSMRTLDGLRVRLAARTARRAHGLTRRVSLACLLLPLLVSCTDVSLVPQSNLQMDPAVLAQMNQDSDRMIVVTVANPSESVPMLAGTTAGGYDGAPGYAAYGSARATVAAIARDYGLREVMAWPIVQLQVHCAVFEVAGNSTRADVLAKLAQDRRVKLAQPLQSFRTLGLPAAPAYDENYVNLERGLHDIGAPAAQRITQGQGVRVAVIDTGVDTAHPDLAGRIALTRDFVERDDTLFNHDVHGTAVAGVIAANPDNGHGIIGVAPRAKILALKACWQTPSAGGGAPGPSICNSLTLAQALAVASESHAQVINLSLSGPPDPLLTQLVEYCLRHGAIVVGAVPPNGDLHAFPVGIAHVIAADMSASGTSASGTSASGAAGEVIYAPGRDVLTLTPGGHYDFLSGSSFSAAYVSGIAALLLAVNPSLDATQVYAALKASAADGGAKQTVNACNALSAVAAGACTTINVAR
jgi:subtilisin family serine protease